MTRGESNGLAVSIVIPTHNRRSLLEQVLLALGEQTHPAGDFEVIVVVDGSTDGTEEMLATMQTPYPLRVLWQDQRGAATARNEGIRMSRGRAVIFLDDDVVPEAGLVRAHHYFHERDERAVVVGHLVPCMDGERAGWEHWEDAIIARRYRRILDGTHLLDGSLFFAGNASVGRKPLEDVGGFDVSLAYQEDVDLGRRLHTAGANFYFGVEAIGHHCGHRPTFTGWCQRYRRFGRCYLEMHERAAPGELRSLGDSYGGLNVLTRVLLGTTLGRRRLTRAAVLLLRAATMVADRARLRIISGYGYSALANLFYWETVQTGLGGRTELRRVLNGETENPHLRPRREE